MYQNKYLSKDEFDNYYITKKFEELDATYEDACDEVLPLGYFENFRYVPTWVS
jgi:hypothetical protein